MTDNEILALWLETPDPPGGFVDKLSAFAHALLAAEREACARACEEGRLESTDREDRFYNDAITRCAAAIRSLA